MTKGKVLITGAAGFIGSNYVSYLMDHFDDEVVVLDKLTYAGDLRNLVMVSDNPKFQFVQGDICDAKLLEQLFAEHQFLEVVHFAAESHVDNSISGPADFIETNIVGTFQLLQAAYKLWMEGLINSRKNSKMRAFCMFLPMRYMEVWAKRDCLLKVPAMLQTVHTVPPRLLPILSFAAIFTPMDCLL